MDGYEGRRSPIHDLRHTGNQLTANAGATPKELMARMGHDSERPALIYLHSSADRQRALADRVGKAAAAELATPKGRDLSKPSGTQRARMRRSADDTLPDPRPERDSNARPTA